MQSSLHNIAIIVNGEVKKSNMVTAVTHIWKNNTIISCPQIQTINVTPIKAKLMAIHLGFISIMDNNDIHNIIIITDSIKAAKNIIESKVNPFQSLIIPLATKIKTFFCKDRKNKI